MNTDNVRRLRDLLARVAEHGPERFNMAYWFGHSSCASFDEAMDRYGVAETDPAPAHCGTSACMAGWCQMAFSVTPAEQQQKASHFAQDFLELSTPDAGEWFTGGAGWVDKDIDAITADDAVAFLNWQLARHERFGNRAIEESSDALD
jgi:hypothetical protein